MSLPHSPGGPGTSEGADPQRSQSGGPRRGGGQGRAEPGRLLHLVVVSVSWEGSQATFTHVPLHALRGLQSVEAAVSQVGVLGWPGVLSLAQVHSLPSKAPLSQGPPFCSLILVGAASFYDNGIWGQLSGWSPGCCTWPTGTGGCSLPIQAAFTGPREAPSAEDGRGRSLHSLSPSAQAWCGQHMRRTDWEGGCGFPGHSGWLALIGWGGTAFCSGDPRFDVEGGLSEKVLPTLFSRTHVRRAALSARVPYRVRAGQGLRGR